ncbi:cytosine permease [Actinoalloteichus cyanogriseus DSM 43889]|uniref:Cytosine permease n=1 Tax=Actinoalloteichus caeruleus DSM 43889 TaxID=1120930 RepID=A0ABT1JE24_ACTCY|nr:cytosine permease [Actinoalloteichus caeruleus DSM 43889]
MSPRAPRTLSNKGDQGVAQGSQPVVDPDYPLAPVPMSARRSLGSLLLMLVSFTFFAPTMLAGGQIAGAFPFAEFLVLSLTASVLLGCYVAVIGVISARTGLSTVLLARRTLGLAGGKWASVLLGGTQIGWFGVTVALLADLAGRALGWESTWPIMVVAGLLMGTTAYFGYRGLEILSAIAVPLMFVLAFWVVARALGDAGGWHGLLSIEPTAELGVATALTIMVGTFVSGGTQVGNWTRFARRPRHAFAAALVAFLVAQTLMLFFGAVGAVVYGEPDFAAVLIQLDLLVLGLLLLVANLWTTNDNAAYAFGVAGAELFGVNDKRPFVIGGVLLGILLAVTGVYEALETFLVVLGIVIPPLGGAVIGQYFLAWRGRLPAAAGGREPVVRWSGLGAYLAGTLVAAVSNVYELGVPPLQGILVAVVAAPLLHRVLPGHRRDAASPTPTPAERATPASTS